jgi:hypothetical protein
MAVQGTVRRGIFEGADGPTCERLTIMKEEMFSPEERQILEMYRNPKSSGLGRATRLGGQYLLAAGIFTYLAIAYQSWYAIFTYLVFVAFVSVRLLAARRLVGLMPKILAKNESRIAELEAGVESRILSDHASKHVADESNP